MNDDLQFSDYVNMLKRHWFISLLTFIVVFGAILAYTLLTVPTYEAKSLVAITVQDQTNFLLGSSVPKVSDIASQEVIIESSDVMYSVYSRHDPNSFKLTVNTVKNSNVIEIDVQSNSSENSASIANDIASTYIAYTTDARMQDAKSNIDFITSTLNEYDSSISALNTNLSYYKSLGTTISKDDLVEYQNLQRELSAKNRVYDNLLQKREEAMLVIGINSTNVKLMEYANAPSTSIKSFPLGISILLGAIVAIGAALGMAMLINSAHEKKPKRF